MEFRVISDSEQNKFDQFIKKSCYGHIFQSYLWGEAKRPAWSPLRVVLEDEGRIRAAASILKRQIPLPRKSFFYLPRGPVLDDWENSRLFDIFMEHLRRFALAEGAVFIKMDPCLSEDAGFSAELFEQNRFKPARGNHDFGGLQPRYTFRLDIRGTLEEIMSAFPKKIRYKINYGLSRGLTFDSPGEAGLPHFMEIMRQASRRGNYVLRSDAYFSKLYRLLARDNAINLTLGYYRGQPVIGGITLAFGEQAWAVYGGQIDKGLHLYAYHAMIWERIKWAKSRGAKWFDFCGVPGKVDPSHPLYGLYYFKKSFGGQFYAYIGEMDLVLVPGLYWLWANCYPVAREMLLKLKKGTGKLNLNDALRQKFRFNRG